jgi:5'-nucleotidase
MGGLARRANAIKAVRKERPDILLLEVGNAWSGAAGLASKSQGKVIVEAMNLMGYDAMAIGPAELALGEAVLRQRIAEAKFPVLSANVYVPSRRQFLAQPYVVRTVRGHHVGIIGLTAQQIASQRRAEAPVPQSISFRAANTWSDDDLVVLNPLSALQRCVQKLQSTADVIVVLSNLGWERNTRLAEEVPGIDLILSAGEGEDVHIQPWTAPKTGTRVCQGGVIGQQHPGELLAELYLDVDNTGAISYSVGNQIVLNPVVKNAPEVIELLSKYREQ